MCVRVWLTERAERERERELGGSSLVSFFVTKPKITSTSFSTVVVVVVVVVDDVGINKFRYKKRLFGFPCISLCSCSGAARGAGGWGMGLRGCVWYYFFCLSSLYRIASFLRLPKG